MISSSRITELRPVIPGDQLDVPGLANLMYFMDNPEGIHLYLGSPGNSAIILLGSPRLSTSSCITELRPNYSWDQLDIPRLDNPIVIGIIYLYWVHLVDDLTEGWVLGAFFCVFNTFAQGQSSHYTQWYGGRPYSG